MPELAAAIFALGTSLGWIAKTQIVAEKLGTNEKLVRAKDDRIADLLERLNLVPRDQTTYSKLTDEELRNRASKFLDRFQKFSRDYDERFAIALIYVTHPHGRSVRQTRTRFKALNIAFEIVRNLLEDGGENPLDVPESDVTVHRYPMVVIQMICDITALLWCNRIKRVAIRIVVKRRQMNKATAKCVNALGPTMKVTGQIDHVPVGDFAPTILAAPCDSIHGVVD